MKYDYAVKANGKWYKAGEEVPETNVNDESTEEAEENTPEKKPKRTTKK